jgi:glycosyltransferase involved in cell wall biosynthesis
VHVETMSFWVLLTLRLALPGAGLVQTVHNVFPYEGGLRLRRMAQRQLLSRIGVVYVAVSPSVAANEAERFHLRCDLIWNWVDISACSAASPRSDHRSVRPIAMVGNCAPYKRHDLGLRAFARLDRNEIRLVHAGLEDSARTERALAEDLGLAERVDFVGYAKNVPGLLAASSLLLLPSEREGLPLIVGEALAVGVPVVATDAPGTRDYAWSPLLSLVESTPDALAEGVRRVLDHPPTDAEMAAAGGDARSRLSPRRGVADYNAVYRHLRPRRRTRPR